MVFSQLQDIVSQPTVGTRYSAILNYLLYKANLSACFLWQ